MIPGLQRTVTLRVTLRCARETPLKLVSAYGDKPGHDG
jgi:hypothetical protein